jgi:hypothetical protein
MRRACYLFWVTMVLTLVASQGAAAANAPAAAANASVERGALEALNRMGNYLRSLKVFQVQAETTKDDVLANGQEVQFGTHVDLLVRMPDRLRVEVVNPRQQRLLLYNGKTFTLWGERVNYYAIVPAPATIGKLAADLHERFDIEMPLEDLFLWGSPQATGGSVTDAFDVGPAEVGGVTCEQYVYRQNGLDWQIWIQQGEYPLPRKVVLTTLTDEARPQYSAVYSWNLAPSFNEAAFEFDPPKGAQRIALAETAGPTGVKK